MAKIAAPLSGQLLVTALLVSLLTGACSRGEPPAGAQEPQAVPVKLQSVETSTVEESSEFVGSLEAEQRVVLRPETEGRITDIFTSSGNRVTVGTPIVQLRPNRNRAQVGAALANVNAAKASRDNAQAQLKAAQAEQISAAADVELQNEEFGRISTLVAQGAFAQQRLDQVRRDRNTAIATLNAAKERVEAARASLDQANAALSQTQSEAEVASEDLQENRVVAPIAGILGDIPVKVGDYVDTDDTLTTITDNQTLELEIRVDASQRDQLRLGVPVELKLLQKDSPIIATGRISFISPQFDPNTQSILAKASFPNPEGRLQDKLKVQARVIWEERPGVLVPTVAISRLGGQTFVYVAQAPEKSEQASSQPGEVQQIARQKPVKLGQIQENQYQVLEGVKPGDKIIVSGIQNLSDGTPIAPESQNSSTAQ